MTLSPRVSGSRARRRCSFEALAAIFGPQSMSTRMVYGVFSLPLGACVVVELVLNVED